MSSTVEAGGAVASPVEGEDTFGDDSKVDKKKKFKPFQKMKNFFRGSSKKRFKPDDSGQKSHSTSALHQAADCQEDDDDDGGFRPKVSGLAGSRSISEDSIFKPDTKETKPRVLENKTVSMENIDSNPFQTELFAKLKSRLSDSDTDEGFPYSPVTTLTHHGLMFDTTKESVPATEKSVRQESEQSQVSMEGFNEDLFSSDWKSCTTAVKKPRNASVDSIPELDMNVSDFEAVQKRSTLSNEAAKHRISVKPKARRLSAKMSVKRRDRSPAPSQLPEVKEEYPTKSQPDTEAGDRTGGHKTVISTIPVGPTTGQSASFIPRSEPKDIPGNAGINQRSEIKDLVRSEPQDILMGTEPDDDTDKARPRSLSPLSTSPVSQSVLQEVKLRKRPVSGKFDEAEVKKDADEPSNELARAFDRAKRISKKFDEGNIDIDLGKPSKPAEKDLEINPHVDVSKPATLPQEENKSTTAASPVKDMFSSTAVSSPVSGVSFVLKKEPLRPTASSPESKEMVVAKTVFETGPTLTEPQASVTVNTVIKEPLSEEVTTEQKATSEISSPQKTVRVGSPEKLASPREDYKLKRAARAKTLPAAKDTLDKTEQKEVKLNSARLGSPPFGGRRRNDYENVVIDVKPSSAGSQANATSSSSEPAWVVRQRLKHIEQEKKIQEDKTDFAKEVKIELKGVIQLKEDNPYMNIGQVKEENPYDNEPIEENIYVNVEPKKETEVSVNKTLSSTEQKTDISKSTVQASSVKAWPQTYSAKPYEKSTARSNSATFAVTKTSSEMTTGVHSVKTPVVANSKTEQDAGSKPSVLSVKPADAGSKPNISPSKPTVSAGTKPVVVSSAASKPSVTALVTPAAPASTKPNTTSNTSKPFSQSLNTKVSGFSGVASAAGIGGFSRSFVSKPSVSVQKSGPDVKPLGQTTVKSVSSAKTDPTTASSQTVSVQDNKKAENDTKNTQMAASVSKPGDKSKPVSSSKPDVSPGVPAWKQALNQKKNQADSQPVRIEIIDKDENKSPKKKVEEKPAVQMREKNNAEKCSSIASNRPSKVLDMVKSFQKLQVT